MSKRTIGPGKVTINGVEFEASEVLQLDEKGIAHVKPELISLEAAQKVYEKYKSVFPLFFVPETSQTVLTAFPGKDGIGPDTQILKKCSVCGEETFCTDYVVSLNPREVRAYCDTCGE